MFASNSINKQNIQGSNYFSQALRALPSQLLEQMFVTRDLNEAGIYAMRFYVNGVEKVVVVDDYLPVDSDGMPAFAKSKVPELWICLLEKAWAKLNGSYHAI